MGIREELAESCGDEEFLFADGLDDAIIGTVAIWAGNTRQRVVLYDYEKCVEILMEGDEDRREEVEEFLEFNTLGAYVGEKTPAYAIITRTALPGQRRRG